MAAKPNYKFQKRQRELEKQKKKAEKAQRKSPVAEAETAGETPAAGEGETGEKEQD